MCSLSHDDHPVLNLVAQENEKDSKLSSSLPHRCACSAKMLCATLHSVVSMALPAAVHPQAAEAHRTVFPGSQETARASRLVLTSSIPRGDCPRSGVFRLHSSTSRPARPGARHDSSRTYATRPVPSWPPKPNLSTRWTHCDQSHQRHC